jgi:hypothetical protein
MLGAVFAARTVDQRRQPDDALQTIDFLQESQFAAPGRTEHFAAPFACWERFESTRASQPPPAAAPVKKKGPPDQGRAETQVCVLERDLHESRDGIHGSNVAPPRCPPNDFVAISKEAARGYAYQQA